MDTSSAKWLLQSLSTDVFVLLTMEKDKAGKLMAMK